MMPVAVAYFAVIIIWGTTPLAIEWSSEGSFIYALTLRMLLGAVTLAALIVLFGEKFPWHRDARRVYLISGVSIYLAMTLVYWSAQHIPSGWISVVFGLSPIFTGVFATYWLKENGLTPMRLLGMALALAGLTLVFGGGFQAGEMAVLGVFVMLLSTVVHAASSVLIKSMAVGIPGFAISAGGIAVASSLLLMSAWAMGVDWTPEISSRAKLAVIYLGIIGSALGFTLYYFLLHRLSAVRVSLMALITPVIALLLGNILNGEPIVFSVWLGAGLIGFGLLFFELNPETRNVFLRFFLMR